jgi:hypothetical protein
VIAPLSCFVEAILVLMIALFQEESQNGTPRACEPRSNSEEEVTIIVALHDSEHYDGNTAWSFSQGHHLSLDQLCACFVRSNPYAMPYPSAHPPWGILPSDQHHLAESGSSVPIPGHFMWRYSSLCKLRGGEIFHMRVADSEDRVIRPTRPRNLYIYAMVLWG